MLKGRVSAAPVAPPRDPAPLPVLMLVATVVPTAMNMYIPAMAKMQVDLGTTASAIQLTLSAFLAVTAIGQVLAGPLSDLFGRKPVLVYGLVLYMVGTAVCVVAPNIDVLIVGRVMQAAGGCVGLVLTRAIIRDVHGAQGSAQMIGYVTMGMATAPMVTPILGGFIYEASNWRMIFVFMAAFGAVSLALAAFRIEETRPGARGKGVFTAWRREALELLSIGQFWVFASTLGLMCIAFFAVVSGGAFLAERVYGLDASEYSIYFVLMLVGYVTGNFITARFGNRLGIVRMIFAGNALSLASLVVILVITVADGMYHPFEFFAPMLLMGIGNGFALPNLVAACISIRPALAGTASGLAGGFQIGSGAITAVAMGFVIDSGWQSHSPMSILVPMLVGATSAMILTLWLRADALR